MRYTASRSCFHSCSPHYIIHATINPCPALFFKRNQLNYWRAHLFLLRESILCGNLSLWERAAWLRMGTSNVFLVAICVVDVAGSNSWVSHRNFMKDPKCKHTSSSCGHLSTVLNGPFHDLATPDCVNWHCCRFLAYCSIVDIGNTVPGLPVLEGQRRPGKEARTTHHDRCI